MNQIRKKYRPACKAKVALAALQGDETTTRWPVDPRCIPESVGGTPGYLPMETYQRRRSSNLTAFRLSPIISKASILAGPPDRKFHVSLAVRSARPRSTGLS